jgi:hypothetical protein
MMKEIVKGAEARRLAFHANATRPLAFVTEVTGDLDAENLHAMRIGDDLAWGEAVEARQRDRQASTRGVVFASFPPSIFGKTEVAHELN